MAWLILLLIPAWMVLNHLRGGGGLFGLDTAKLLPGATDPWCAFVVAIFAGLAGITLDPYFVTLPSWATGPLVSAAVFALCWLAWSTPAWGFLQGLGNGPGPIATRQPSWYEALFLKTGNPYIAYALRTTLFLIPMALLFGWYWILLGPIQVVCYAIAWAIRPTMASGIPYGELITGACWGAMASFSALMWGFS